MLIFSSGCSKKAAPPPKPKVKPAAVKAKLQPEVPGELLARARLVMARDPSQAMAWLRRYAGAISAGAKRQSMEDLDAWSVLVEINRTGRASMVLPGHDRAITALAFSGDDELFASGDEAGLVKLWKWKARRPHGELSAEDGGGKAITVLLFAPDGQTLASAYAGGDVTLWNLGSGGPMPRTARLGAEVTGLAFSKDSKRLKVSGGETQIMVNVTTGAAPDGSAGSASIFPPEKERHWLAAPRPDGGLKLVQDGLSKGSKARVLQLKGHRKKVTCTAFSSDGGRLASGSEGGRIRLWRLSLQPLVRWNDLTRGKARGAALTGDGRGVVLVDNKGGVCVHTTAGQSRRCLPQRRRRKANLELGASRNGRWLLVRSGNAARVWNLMSGKIRGVAVELDELTALSPDGGTLALVTYDGELLLRSTATGTEITRSKERHAGSRVQEVYAVTYSPGGERLATSRKDGSVQIWNAVTLAPVGRALMAGVQIPDTPVFTNDAAQLIVGERSGRVAFWDAKKGILNKRAPKAHSGQVTALALAPDGELMASAGSEGQERLWYLGARKPRDLPLGIPGGACRGLGFTSDGRELICVTTAGLVATWDLWAATPEEIRKQIDGQTNVHVDREGKVSLN